MGLFGKKCERCGEHRTRHEFEGLPMCEACEVKIKADRERKLICPVDSAEMKKDITSGIIIDHCPECGGIWLDAGELKLITQAARKTESSQFAETFAAGLPIA